MGNHERVKLPAPHWEDANPGHEINTGLYVEALYKGPRSGRMFARMYSKWQTPQGGIVGQHYVELLQSQYLHYCEQVGCDPQQVEPTEV